MGYLFEMKADFKFYATGIDDALEELALYFTILSEQRDDCRADLIASGKCYIAPVKPTKEEEKEVFDINIEE